MENNFVISFLLKLFLKIVYFPLKFFKTKNKIVMISREYNEPPVDFILLKNELLKQDKNVKVVFLCKTLEKSLKDSLLYCFYLIKCCYNLATSFACVVDTYCIPVSVLNHKKTLKIIQIWHALGALKQFGYQTLGKAEGSNIKTAKKMCMHKNYDIVTCASLKTKEFYSEAFNIPLEKISVVGMPRIDLILKQEPNLKNNFLNNYPKFKGKKIILYVPTFRKDEPVNYIPLTSFNKEKFSLIVKPHILSEQTVEKKYLVNGYSTFDLLKIADYIITDYSAVSFEASLLNKPLYFYLYDLDKYSNARGLNVNIKDEMPTSCFTNATELVNSIEKNIYNFSELKQFKEKYIETADENNSKRIANLIINRE